MGQAEMLDKFLERLVAQQPRYVGIYSPGDFKGKTYRLVLPDFASAKPGRGFGGAREEVVLEAQERAAIEQVLQVIEALVDAPFGPRAVRHIVNPKQSKDEGLRLIWDRDGEDGELEMADWPRRDQMMREGKTVVEKELQEMPIHEARAFGGACRAEMGLDLPGLYASAWDTQMMLVPEGTMLSPNDPTADPLFGMAYTTTPGMMTPISLDSRTPRVLSPAISEEEEDIEMEHEAAMAHDVQMLPCE